MGNVFYFDWEVQFMAAIQKYLGEAGASFANRCSFLGEELILIMILAVVYLGFDKEKGRVLGLTIVMSLVANPMIKNFFFRLRPYFVHDSIKCLRPLEPERDLYDAVAQGYSFPSGHSMNSASVYGGLARAYKKKWLTILCIIPIVLVGVSRFMLGNHYPTDVFVGWICGIIFVLLAPFLYHKVGYRKRWILYVCLLAISLCGLFYCKSDDYYTGLGIMIGFVVGDLFEGKYVNFKNTRYGVALLLRVVMAGVLFIILSTLLKMPFSEEFLSSVSALSHLVRTMRYALIVFIEVALLPWTFAPIEKALHIKSGLD